MTVDSDDSSVIFSHQDMKLFAAISLVIVLLTANALAQQAPPSALTRTKIKEAERLLSEQGYWTGPVDGVFDADTRSALIAFQKWHGRESTGQLTTEELEAIRTSTSPRAREVGYEHVEVDLDRQVLMLVNDNGGSESCPSQPATTKRSFTKVRKALLTHRGVDFWFITKRRDGRVARSGELTSRTLSAAASRSTAAGASPTNLQATAAFASRCSPPAKSASFSSSAQSCSFTTKFRSFPRRTG